MSEPIKIVLTAETAEAAAKLQAFCQNNAIAFKSLTKEGKEAEGMFAANRMGIMELEHSARSMMDGLVAGINPMRMLAMEGPRLMQAGTMMTEEFKTKLMGFLPILGGVGVAIAAGAVAWHYYGDALVDPTKRARELADAMQQLPDILKQIQTAQRAGVISPDQAEKYRKMLTGEIPLYNKVNVADAFGGHAERDSSGFWGSLGKEKDPTTGAILRRPLLTTNAADAMPDWMKERGLPAPPAQKANIADIKDYVQWLMSHEGATDATDRNPAQDVAAVDLRQSEMRWSQQSTLGPDKQEARIRRQAEDAKNRLEQEHSDAKLSKGWTTDDEEKYQAQIKAIDADADAAIGEIRQRVAAEAATKSAEAQKKIQEAAAKDGVEQLKALEKQITANQDQEGHLRGQFAVAEYVQRAALLVKLLAEGEITQAEYSDKMEDAQHKANEGIKEYRAELEKVAALEQEIARSKIEAQLRDIHGDQFSTQSEKDAQSIPLYQQLMLENQKRIEILTTIASTTQSEAAGLEAERQRNELLQQNADLAAKMSEAMKTQSATVAFGTMFANLRNEAEINFSTLASTFQDVFNTAVQAISHGITGLIEGTMTWGQALRSIRNSILNEIISAIVQMGVRWLLTQAIMAMGGRAIMASAIAASAPIAAAQAAIWTPAAVMATIGTLGAAAVAAPGFIGEAEAMSLGLAAFAEGGRPVPGDLALVGEEGPELFIPDTAGTIVPADQTARMLNATPRPLAGSGAAVGPGPSPGGNKVSVYSFVDKTEMQHHLEQNEDHEKWVVGVIGKNAHKFA